jgi:hypothetical protein
MALAAHLWSRVRKGGYPTNRRFDALRHFRGFRFFIWGTLGFSIPLQPFLLG